MLEGKIFEDKKKQRKESPVEPNYDKLKKMYSVIQVIQKGFITNTFIITRTLCLVRTDKTSYIS